jgi:hypothetical protein
MCCVSVPHTPEIPSMKIDLTLTTPGGCTIKIKGDYDIFADKNGAHGFTGGIDLSGTCPIKNGHYDIKSATVPGHRGLTATLDTEDPAKMSKMTWHGHTEVAKILNEPTVNGELCSFVRKHARTSPT